MTGEPGLDRKLRVAQGLAGRRRAAERIRNGTERPLFNSQCIAEIVGAWTITVADKTVDVGRLEASVRYRSERCVGHHFNERLFGAANELGFADAANRDSVALEAPLLRHP